MYGAIVFGLFLNISPLYHRKMYWDISEEKKVVVPCTFTHKGLRDLCKMERSTLSTMFAFQHVLKVTKTTHALSTIYSDIRVLPW